MTRKTWRSMRRFKRIGYGLALLAIGACASPTEIPDRPADADGFVVSVAGKSVHIKSTFEQCGIVFTITDDTRILAARGNNRFERAGMADVTVGRRAQGWADGAIAESCPAQARAEVVVLN
jgi:hypothetical protein